MIYNLNKNISTSMKEIISSWNKKKHFFFLNAFL